ncbi:YqhR family membrane protein [Marinicrinis lubricantis]|uniref:YqhR family membrane protein n=1 Tax=Marinicrinis lubricantis TaxID=2086470 RepID=A0ABW1IRZ3_9BACL
MSTVSQTVHRSNKWLYALHIGFFAGLIWGGIQSLLYYFEMTEWFPAFLAEPFYKHEYLQSTEGRVLGWLYFILFSILASFIYTLFLAKFNGPWIGLIYGFAWWVIIAVAIGPFMGIIEPITRVSLNTMTTEFCLFLLWGIFIGYSITLEFNDERKREPEPLTKMLNK